MDTDFVVETGATTKGALKRRLLLADLRAIAKGDVTPPEAAYLSPDFRAKLALLGKKIEEAQRGRIKLISPTELKVTLIHDSWANDHVTTIALNEDDGSVKTWATSSLELQPG